MKLRPFLLIVACLSAAWVIAQEDLPQGAVPAPGEPAAPVELPPTDARHYSYAIGLDVGASFRQDKLKLDVDSLMSGLKDGLGGAEPKYSKELCAVSLERLARERMEMMRKRDQDFLADNAKAEGVTTLPSGLQFKVVKEGAGESPQATDTVEVHYTGKLVDGTVFDSSEGSDPIRLQVDQFIDGWSEALQKMKVGDKWQVFIPSELGYGEEGYSGTIPPNATLIFDVELMAIGENEK